MIKKETAAAIWECYREINTAEALLDEMEKEMEKDRFNKDAPTLKDAFGQKQHLQLGIPTGRGSHKLYNLSPTLAKSVITAHIANKQAELCALNECARLQLSPQGEAHQ